MKFTVLGSNGFIGSHVAALARSQGHVVFCPSRNEPLIETALGHVIYAIGVTADFRQRPHETITAHVTKLQEVLIHSSFESLVYLSSTRVYARCGQDSKATDPIDPVSETTPVPVLSSDFSDLYNLSKLMGESIALAHGKNVRVARLSNVLGPDFDSNNFLTSVLRDCVQTGGTTMHSAIDSAKDYVSVDDVASVLLKIGPEGRSPIYNIASGNQTSNRELIDVLCRHTNATIQIAQGSPTQTFPPIDISLAKEDFDFTPMRLDACLPALIDKFQRHYHSPAVK